jgi:hypothetical protein
MAHKKKNAKLQWRTKGANHGIKPGKGKEKSQFRREFRRKREKGR